ncbi:cytochrome c oxidase assembly protein CtaG [Iodidimonas nitroreducens]|uniref:Cytochrome c oxidase assembly protein CtaG n=1 Tax=Iodidimonas nitroreducens TaxID=1236968 RepID=A0A5A7N656_9PROT|nr:cytochrome c oxidase assembly protein [Iodidimonas nitroreducens]GAK34104.1 cytochrome c oxidase assembly protein CtaG [alpha proteobacterium Q-1]GER03802.1 cytochrome c oxidase assembly protein CtaG [Iodidimonas nitroreducens]
MTQATKNLRAVGLALLALAASGSLAVFAVPLYQLFCQVTGYGGTTQRVDQAGVEILDRVMEVRFDGSVDSALPWAFKPVQTTQSVKVGETALAFYEATNLSDKAITGTAVFNVTPHKAGLYFSKIECFCFTEQTLQPGETVNMPVTYFIDPAIAEEDNLDGVSQIVLSYTFFYQETPEPSANDIHAALDKGAADAPINETARSKE